MQTHPTSPWRLIRRLARPALLLVLASLPLAAALQEKKARDVSQFNLGKSALALAGYDPVSYFAVDGGGPKKGEVKLETLHDGVRYRFMNEANRTAFLANPAAYEPAYGGWCAWAMADKEKVEVDALSFVVRDGRLFLFYQGWFNDTRAKWLKDPAKLVKQADVKWAELIAPPKPKQG